MKLVSSAEEIFDDLKSAWINEAHQKNILQCFAGLIVASLDIIQTSLFLGQKYE